MSPAPPCWMTLADDSVASLSRATTNSGADVGRFARTKSSHVPSERSLSVKIACTGLNLARKFSASRHDRARHVSIPWLASATRHVCIGSNSA